MIYLIIYVENKFETLIFNVRVSSSKSLISSCGNQNDWQSNLKY